MSTLHCLRCSCNTYQALIARKKLNLSAVILLSCNLAVIVCCVNVYKHEVCSFWQCQAARDMLDYGVVLAMSISIILRRLPTADTCSSWRTPLTAGVSGWRQHDFILPFRLPCRIHRKFLLEFFTNFVPMSRIHRIHVWRSVQTGLCRLFSLNLGIFFFIVQKVWRMAPIL